jgi:hypothetical protein
MSQNERLLLATLAKCSPGTGLPMHMVLKPRIASRLCGKGFVDIIHNRIIEDIVLITKAGRKELQSSKD